MDIQTLIFAAAVALAFSGVYWIAARLGANTFWSHFFAALAAVLVFLTHSLLGVKV